MSMFSETSPLSGDDRSTKNVDLDNPGYHNLPVIEESLLEIFERIAEPLALGTDLKDGSVA
jgi:hypothetical protein